MRPTRFPDLEFAYRTLVYDPNTGLFSRKNGSKCETSSAIYKLISVNGVRVGSHRLAWAMFHGQWPEHFIDHIDGDKHNNRINNLRECTYSENYQNRKLCRLNKYGLTGVSLHKVTGKYVAQIQVDKKRIHLGLFDCPNMAHEAYKNAKLELHSFQPILRES